MVSLRARLENAPARDATANTGRTRAQNIEFMHGSSDPTFLRVNLHGGRKSRGE